MKTRLMKLIFGAFFGGLIASGCTSVSEDYATAMVETVVERNDSIVATGYAVISIQKSDNPAQQRILSIRASKLDAYRSLLEQVYGQYLDVKIPQSPNWLSKMIPLRLVFKASFMMPV